MSYLNHPPPEWLTENYMEIQLRQCLRDRSLTVQSIDIQPGSSAGFNYTCQILRVIVKMCSSFDGSMVLSLIAKLKSTFMPPEVFDAETNFYTNYHWKLFEIIENDPNAAINMPKFYFVDKANGILFIEDLSVHGFVMAPRTKFLNLNESELAIDALASFHGASLWISQKENLRDKLPHCKRGDVTRPLALLIKNGHLSLKKHISSYGLAENYQRRILQIQEDTEAGKLTACIKDGTINVLSHGDSWKNNVMYHYTDGIADDARLIDFDGINFSSFAHDLQYFFFMSVSSNTIISKLDYLLERYFEKLQAIAPVTSDLSLELIKSEFADRYFFGYMLAVLFRTIVIAETPVDMVKIIREDGIQDNGFDHATYITDLHNLLPFFEKVGII